MDPVPADPRRARSERGPSTRRRWESSSGPLWPRRIVGATGRRGPTEKIWYYDLSDIKVGKKTPLTIDRFDEFFRLIPTRGDSDRSWTATRAEIEARGYDLKAVNPRAKSDEDTRTPEELLDIIEEKGRDVEEAVAKLRSMLG